MSDETVVPLEVTGVMQRVAWVQRTLPPVEQLRPDLWSIPVPMQKSPLRYVSVYVLGSESGLTMVDAGWDSEESWDALLGGLAGIGASIGDVHGVLVTHQHLDHIGLARRVRPPPARGSRSTRRTVTPLPTRNSASRRWPTRPTCAGWCRSAPPLPRHAA